MALKPRTGNQYVISSGEWSAVVTELGASLRELKWRPLRPEQGHSLLQRLGAGTVPEPSDQWSVFFRWRRLPDANRRVRPPILPARLRLPLHVGAR